MARRHRKKTSFWQSYADLALGMMAVFALVLVMLLWSQNHTKRELQGEHDKALQAKAQLEVERELLTRTKMVLAQERQAFAEELVQLLGETLAIVENQDQAEDWIKGLFDEGDCRLRLSPSGAIEILPEPGEEGVGAAELYPPAQVRLSDSGAAALESCGDNFIKLARCLSPDGDESCLAGDTAVGASDATARQLRLGIEALVLEGNTDAFPVGTGGGTQLDPRPRSFLGNARLGSERARSALMHLLRLVQPEEEALEVLMNRVRIESPSFGKYQAGPLELREGTCDPARRKCAEARNLALRLRWRKSELRRPFESVRVRVCSLLRDPESTLAKGLRDAGRDVGELVGRLKCSPEEAPR